MIYIVFALSQFEVYDIYGVYLLHLFVWLANSYIFCYCLRNAIQHTVEISQFSAILHLNDAQFSVFALCQNIHTIVFVFLVFLIAFAFKKSMDFEFLSYQRRQEPFYHGIVSLVAQQALHCPVEPYVVFFIFYHNASLLFLFL